MTSEVIIQNVVAYAEVILPNNELLNLRTIAAKV